ncbi:hypothetical protein CQW23_29186 [Capsicum baccatum]|uniref:Tf2-1-like SH3-like domain-containing protein n=1 Tax=Capsicum baccatum TaxID=33114 RepID=A0A2G2VIR9_CAPBA|nr:hypothetical protein CQW23_29186 [Capsicum baccatum]
MKGVMRFEKRGKLSPRYIGPYQIVRRIGGVAYELELPAILGSVHPVFHISMLKKCIGDHSLVVPIDEIKVGDSLSYEEEPVEILDRQVRKLRSKEIVSVKVLWRNQKVEEATWESEHDMKVSYPSLFEPANNELEGNVKFIKRTFEDIDCVLQSWLDEHVKKRERVDFVDGSEENFIDVMLSMMSNEDFIDGYSRQTTIKATALSMVLVASDITSIHLNRVMDTLLNHRDAMKKVQEEPDTNVGRQRWVEESDIKDLGYHIPKGTRLWVNTMKLHRDPKIWSNPDTFDPERFLTSQAVVDVRGQQYEFIPFGSARRSCLGITYATQVTHLAIAYLLQGFNFRTPSDEPLDMKEGIGVTMRKADPIEVFITPRLPSVLYKL